MIGPTELISLLVMVYLPICICLTASKLKRNGLLFGLLSIIPVVNLIILGILAFCKEKSNIQTLQ
jgi:hypothetical protein